MRMTATTRRDAGEQGRLVLPLRKAARHGVAEAGSKATNLAMLLDAGFPVPEGFVVTVDAFVDFLATIGDEAGVTSGSVAGAPLPSAIRREVAAAVADLGDVPLAVRSSGVSEDLPGASFAGQYETVLNVRGAEAVLEAVQRCWASAFTERVTAYRESRGLEDGPRMAVLVQRMVPADAAGVAFTANPVTGDRTETLVSAVRGLGERLVSGQASPDEWTVGDDASAVCRHAPERAIDSAQARRVAALARRVEAFSKVPQDVEWAIAGGEVLLLQARPITTLGPEGELAATAPVEAPPGFWEREISHFPRPLTPLFRSVILPIENETLRSFFDEASPLLETVQLREIGGSVYQRLVPLGGKDRSAPPAPVMWLMVRVVPRMRSRIRAGTAAIREDLFGGYIERWYADWKPALEARIRRLRQVSLDELSDESLAEHAESVVDLVTESHGVHFRLNPSVILMLAELAFACRDLLGWDDRRVMDLLSGLSETSSAPALRLAEVASLARMSGASGLLADNDDRTLENLSMVDPAFAAALDSYQSEFGCRALRYEFMEATLAEQPALILGLVRDQIDRGYDPASDAVALGERRAAAVAEARTALATRPVADRDRFERALARAQRAYPVREDNEFYAVSCPYALVRYAFLEVGRRLVRSGRLDEVDDVFFLTHDETRGLLQHADDLRGLVQERRRAMAWAEAHPGPTSYGRPPGPPPPLSVLPPGPRFMMEGILWGYERTFPPAPLRQSGDAATLTGIAAAAGRYTGSVRVVMDESEFRKVRAGDILVCPITSPVWSVLFPSVGAVITDTGGILSHSAIIAREYRIPAVVATGNATRLLHDGQLVTVDGGAGLVKVLSSGPEQDGGR